MKKDNKKMGIGKNLKYICKMRGITLKELSEKSGVPIGTIYSITLRDPESINSDTMRRFCDALGIEDGFLLYGDVLGWVGYGIPEKEKVAKSTNGLGALITLEGYDLEFSQNGFELLYPTGDKIEVNPDDFEELTEECSKLVRYVLNDFIYKKK